VTDRLPLRLKFWGVRGSIPTPEAGTLGHGGNTACVQVQYGDRVSLIFDAGSGSRQLGHVLVNGSDSGDRTTPIFLSHCHWDHIHGLPFFAPLYRPGWKVVFYSTYPGGELEARLGAQLKPPYFAAESAIRAAREYRQMGPDGVEFGGLTVRSFPLNHPGGCAGYRIDSPSRSVVYATDHEHGDPASEQALRQWAKDVDILIYDAQFTPEEYPKRRGWGHSTWLEGTRVASDSGVKQLVLFHHDPEHDDQTLSRMLAEAQAEFPNTICAKEGLAVSL